PPVRGPGAVQRRHPARHGRGGDDPQVTDMASTGEEERHVTQQGSEEQNDRKAHEDDRNDRLDGAVEESHDQPRAGATDHADGEPRGGESLRGNIGLYPAFSHPSPIPTGSASAALPSSPAPG